MYRRRFLLTVLSGLTASASGCIGGSAEEDEHCLPEDPQEFFHIRGHAMENWAPEGNGFSLEHNRDPRRPDSEREDHEPIYWVHHSYEDEAGNTYMLSIRMFNDDSYARDYGSAAEPGQIAFPYRALIDAPTVISGARGPYAYEVLGEDDALRDEVTQLFLMVPCLEEEHILDTTW